MSKISILLPTLNISNFLEERIDSIFQQTYRNWELIVVDGYSNDGSWELIQDFAKHDDRIRIAQAPREGVYAAINRCIDMAQGDYVYIATGDDTMTPDCLEKMLNALDNNPDCDIAHCCLTLIDEKGNELKNKWQTWDKVRFFEDILSKEHIRQAPHDGLLYCSLGTIYTSLTELLIRKKLFDEIGLFKTEFGSHGDFEWGCRAGLVSNTVHVPYYLATWRLHTNQVTQNDFIFSSAGKALWCEMIESALTTLKEKGYELPPQITSSKLTFYYRFQQLASGLGEQPSIFKKTTCFLQFILIRPDVSLKFLSLRILKKSLDRLNFARTMLKQLGFDKNILLVKLNSA